MQQEQTHLTPKDLANRWNVCEATLARWRRIGQGPQFIKVGRRVLYPMPMVKEFETSQLSAAK